MLLGKPADRGRTAADNRLFGEAVLGMAQSGAAWRDLPEEFGRWNSVYQCVARRQEQGVWERVFAALAEDADFEEVFMDSPVIRVHQHAAGATSTKGAGSSSASFVASATSAGSPRATTSSTVDAGSSSPAPQRGSG